MSLSKKDKAELVEAVIMALAERHAAAVDGDSAAEEKDENNPDFFADQAARWAKNGIESKLAGVTIAPEDFYVILEDGTKKTHFTYDEAEKYVKDLPNGWRPPTRHEWALIAEEFGNNENDELSSEKMRGALGLGLNGWVGSDGDLYGQGSYGYYWSSTRYSGYNMYDLYLNTSDAYPANNFNRDDGGYSVRCVLQASS